MASPLPPPLTLAQLEQGLAEYIRYVRESDDGVVINDIFRRERMAKMIYELRDEMIRCDRRSGVDYTGIGIQYRLKPGRVSQICHTKPTR